MVQAASPSILILRSTCRTALPSPVNRAGKSPNEGIVENRSDGGGEPWMTSTFLDEPIQRLALSPIVCDITVLPETLDGSFASVDQGASDEITVEAHRYAYHFLQRQTLNPCGIDNVIVMPPLSSSDKEITDSYLLSLSSCTTSISLQSQDTTMLSNLDHLRVNDELRLLTVKPNPSTFVFDFHKGDSSGSSSHHGHIANLDVEFDLSLAHQQLVEFVSYHQRTTSEKQGNSKARETNSRNERVPQSGSTFEASPNVATKSRHKDNMAFQILQSRLSPLDQTTDRSSEAHPSLAILQSAIERETDDLNFLLACLGIMGLLLFLLYIWTTYKIIQSTKCIKKKKHTSGTPVNFFTIGSSMISDRGVAYLKRALSFAQIMYTSLLHYLWALEWKSFFNHNFRSEVVPDKSDRAASCPSEENESCLHDECGSPSVISSIHKQKDSDPPLSASSSLTADDDISESLLLEPTCDSAYLFDGEISSARENEMPLGSDSILTTESRSGEIESPIVRTPPVSPCRDGDENVNTITPESDSVPLDIQDKVDLIDIDTKGLQVECVTSESTIEVEVGISLESSSDIGLSRDGKDPTADCFRLKEHNTPASLVASSISSNSHQSSPLRVKLPIKLTGRTLEFSPPSTAQLSVNVGGDALEYSNEHSGETVKKSNIADLRAMLEKKSASWSNSTITAKAPVLGFRAVPRKVSKEPDHLTSQSPGVYTELRQKWEGRQLSPCSRLAENWEKSKEVRRKMSIVGGSKGGEEQIFAKKRLTPIEQTSSLTIDARIRKDALPNEGKVRSESFVELTPRSGTDLTLHGSGITGDPNGALSSQNMYDTELSPTLHQYNEITSSNSNKVVQTYNPNDRVHSPEPGNSQGNDEKLNQLKRSVDQIPEEITNVEGQNDISFLEEYW